MIDEMQIELPLEAIQSFCRQHPIKRLSVFGSVLRDDFSDESDIDLLVEYLPNSQITLLDMAQQEYDLSEMVGKSVDLRTANELSRHFRQTVIDTSVVVYERS